MNKLVVVLAILVVGLGSQAVAAEHPVKCATSTIAFTNTCVAPCDQFTASEIYVTDWDGTDLTNPRRLTDNTDGDANPALSPDGKGRIVFDSNRNRVAGEPLNTSDLFLMKDDGSHQTLLTRGSSATWSPDSKFIAFHASASGTGLPIRPDPGAPTADSDIFVARVGDLLEDAAARANITNTPDEIEEDADWSPDGQKIVFTRHHVGANLQTAEIWLMNADGTGQTQLTFNSEEERAPAWSPDGTRIAYMCRKPTPSGALVFEICVMNADGTGQTRLTFNSVFDGVPHWSPDGLKIVFQRPVAGQQQVWVMNADGTGQTQLTFAPGDGANFFPSWGEIKTKCTKDAEDN